MSEQPITHPVACPVPPPTTEERAAIMSWLIVAIATRFVLPIGTSTILLALHFVWPLTFEIRSVVAWMALIWFCCWVVEYMNWEQLARIGSREHVISRRDRIVRLILMTFLFAILLRSH